MKREKSILIGLNEINFDYIEKYTGLGYLPNFKKVFAEYGYMRTVSESTYELLEPWIQWVTIHTGKTYDEHKVFRLGDIVDRKDLRQLWEIAEEKGLTVGAVSPFNGRNNLKEPVFFVPDPWTKTTPQGEPLIVDLSHAVSAAVNSNANNKVGKKEIMVLLRSLLKYVPFGRKLHYGKLLTTKLRKKATKAAILDNLLADVFISQWKTYKPDFSSLFLNSGAHEQHYYMFNSKAYNGNLKNPDWYCPSSEDPILDILTEYDQILGMLLQLDCRLFIATGLHQTPYTKKTFYWRLKEHSAFLNLLGVETFDNVLPRMSRDFLVNFKDASSAKHCESLLNTVTLNGQKVFEIDNRSLSLFIELIYPDEIKANDFIVIEGKRSDIDLHKYVSFVAIKNGEHDQEGYFIDTRAKSSKDTSMPLKEVFSRIVSSFD